MSLLDNLPHTATINRPRYKQDAYMADTEVLVPLRTGVSCWVQNASSAEILEYQRRDQRITHRVLFAADPSLRPGDVLVPDNGPFAGAELTVEAITERTAGLGWMWTAMTREDTNEPPNSFT